MPRASQTVRAAALTAGLVALAAGCTISTGGGTPVNLPTVVPEATSTYTAYVDIVDAYVAPARAGGAVVFHATISNGTLSNITLVSVSAPTGTAQLNQVIGSGYFTGLGPGAVLGTTTSGLKFGQTLPVTMQFNRGGSVTVDAPVGGTATGSSASP
jgi:copper(I)-binding protein